MGLKSIIVKITGLKLKIPRVDKKILFRWVIIAFVYLAVFSLLDMLSQKFQIFPGVVAWYPPDGVSFAFLLGLGSGFTPLVAFASIISSLIIYQFKAPLMPILVWAIVLSSSYGINAFLLRNRFTKNLQIPKLRNILIWMVSSAIVSTFLATVSIFNLVKFGVVPASQTFDATFQWWIGEMIGLLVFTPFLLIYVMPWIRRFGEGKRVFLRRRKIHFKPEPEGVAQAISMLVILYLVFGVIPLQKFHTEFLIALPLIWVAMRRGFARTCFAIVLTNFGIMVAIWLFNYQAHQIGGYQFLLFAIFFIVLIIGAISSRQKESEEILRKAEIHNRALIENAPDGIILMGADRIIKYRSPSTERLLGYDKNNNPPSIPAMMTHPDDASALKDLFDNLILTPGKIATTQYRIRHRDGSWRWLESTFTNQLDNPSLEAVVINFRDITERKLVEEALRQSEKRFKALIENSQEEISLLSADGILTYESPTSRRPLGYPQDAMLGGTIFDLFHPDDREAAIQLFKSVASIPGCVKYAQFKVKRQNGSWIWMEGYISNMLEDPAVQSIVLNYSDVTDRVIKEQEITVLAKIPSESPNPVMRMNREGVLLYANEISKSILSLWGCSIGEYLPKYMMEIANVAFGRNEIIPVEINCVDQVFALTVTPIVEAGYINLYGRDITKRVRTEEKLKVSNDELSMLFRLSHSLAEADNLGNILDIVNRNAVESIHNTFARIALLEHENFLMTAAYPVSAISQDLQADECVPVSQMPISYQILANNEPRIIYKNDQSIRDEEKKVLFKEMVQSICMVPLRINDSSPVSEKLVGLLILGETSSEKRELFTPEKINLANTIGESAAIAIRRLHLLEQTEKRMRQLVALSEIDQGIISNTDMQHRLDVVCTQVMEQLKVDAVDVWVFNQTAETLSFSTSIGFQTSAFKSKNIVKIDEGMIGNVVLKRQMIHLSDLSTQNQNPRLAKALTKEPFIGYYAVPLIAKNEVKGVLEIFHKTELEGDPEWLSFLQILATQAAIAIDNSSLFTDLQQTNVELIQAYDATIQGWSRALDLRDNETEGHTQRVTEMTMKLAHMFGLPEEDLVHIRRGALLHDIGKMGVPDRILLKPGPLTDEEWVIMRKHTSFAYDLLSPISFLKPALDIPMCHHEKWDGTGYPRGLAGEQIPFAARIFSVVDVWDALTSDRPYRVAWSEEKVLDYIRSLSGSQFDPQVVSVCLEPGFLTGVHRTETNLEPMQWSEHYSVGVRELDLQHQKLIGLINRLISVTGTEHVHSETVISILDEMTRYAQVHFTAEERLMATYGFERLEDHKVEHLCFQKRIDESYDSLKHGVKKTADDLLNFLRNWLAHHILVEDMAYKVFFQENGLE